VFESHLFCSIHFHKNYATGTFTVNDIETGGWEKSLVINRNGAISLGALDELVVVGNVTECTAISSDRLRRYGAQP
jgi:hypothetical protein